MKCPACGFQNPADSGFCEECGTKLERSCPSCGSACPPTAKFCRKCGQPVSEAKPRHPTPDPRSYTPKHLAEKILTSRSALEGERKQVTVLFADVKGSMELAEQLDAEEWHRIMDRFFAILSEGVHRFEGTVNQYTGDGIMALFGAPIAHEDHARRACYAALRLSETLRQYADELRRDLGLNFSVRLGLNSGAVVVGKIGDNLRMDYTAQGHTVGLAARMEQLAEPGKAYVTEDTAKLVEGFFRLGDLGRFNVKGTTEPLRVYDLQGVGPLRTRIELAVRRGLVRFVGRRGEMAQLHRAWESAQQGHGQIVALMGEAGVGKSRLFYEFKVPLQSKCLVLEAFSVSHGKAYAYLPLVDLLKGYFQISLEDGERQRREKVGGKVLMLDRTLEDTLPYLFSLLGIADPASSLQQMDAQIRRQRTMDAVKRVLVRETLNQPLIVVFEDLHWSDSETQAFLEVLSDSVATARLLLLVNYRPEYRHGWGSKTYYIQLRLDPLGNKEAQELLRALLGDGTATGMESLKQLILEKTGGNPFFMEEVVQTLAEEGVLTGERGNYSVAKRPAELNIPATVQGVLAARIDRLPADEKRLLQTLAVIGKEFSFGLARQVSEQGDDELHRLLSRLQAGEFIYEQPAFPEPEYTFKHALTQEVAYQSVLSERRKLLHERTGKAIEDLHPYGLDEHYDELAHHYTRSDNTRKAVEYLHLAGRAALDRSAHEEAITQLTNGLRLLATLPESPERDRQELPLQTTLAPALSATRGWLSADAEEAYGRARELCERVGDTAQLVPGLGGVLSFCMMRAQFSEALQLGERMLSLAQSLRDPVLPCVPHAFLGETLFWLGEFARAREHFEEGIAAYNPRQSQHLRSVYFATDPGVSCLSYLGWILQRFGHPDQARERNREALNLARELSHPMSQCSALGYGAWLHLWLGESQAAQERAVTVTTLAEEHAFPDWLMWASVVRAAALAEQGEQIEEGISQITQAIEVYRAMGAQIGLAGLLMTLAETQAKLGQTEEALARVADASEIIEATGESQAESRLYWIKGGLLWTLSRDAEAESCFQRAIDVARRQSAKWSELQAALGLARLWQRQDKKAEARQLLAEIYDWFTEGFDTRDLKEARALLEELS